MPDFSQKALQITQWSGLLLLVLFQPLGIADDKQAVDEQIVNVYSARQENLIKPLLEQFTRATGIKVNLVTGKADTLLTRLQAEGENSPVDLFITTDAGRLYRAQSLNLLQCIETQAFNHIPSSYRDPQGCWFGLSLRARVIMTVADKVAENAIANYASLASPQWKNQICIRPSSNIYNQSLVASILAINGEVATLQWLQGFVSNFARPPSGGDRDQILAAANGLCDIAIANTYYLAMMLESDNQEHKKAAQKMRVVFPNQDGRGAHVNISGAGISRSAPHFKNALALLEYLSSPSAQAWYAMTNYEYPVTDKVTVPQTLKSWGDFKKDTINLRKLGELNTAALKLMNKAGWQ